MTNDLRFLTSQGYAPVGMIPDILSAEYFENITEGKGAYIIVGTSKTKFIYPRGLSRVIYIGKASNLRRRLKDHHSICVQMSTKNLNDRIDSWYYPRYQYIKEFGGQIFWFRTKGKQTCDQLEHDLLDVFYNRYYALPVGNGAFPKIN